MGSSRGGLTTKIHALVDANELLITLKLTPGQAQHGKSAADRLHDVGEDQVLLADRAYVSDALRTALSYRGAWANIRPMPNIKNIPAFSPSSITAATIQCFFSRLKNFGAVATRYEKHDAN